MLAICNRASAATYNIASNTVWNTIANVQADISSYPNINGSIEIASGVTLTINGSFTFIFTGSTYEILVKPGGKLIVKAGNVFKTPSATNIWLGINVSGLSTTAQYSSYPPDYQYQGGTFNPSQTYCKIESSIIERAKNGVHSIDGAITEVEGCTFTNCMRSFWATDYTSPDLGKEHINACHVTNCSMVVNQAVFDFLGSNDWVGWVQVQLEKVRGVHVDGNVMTKSLVADPDEHGKGIWTADATVVVHKSGLPSVDPVSGCLSYPGVPNKISGFTVGIDAWTSQGIIKYDVSVTETEITKCEFGIRASWVNKVLLAYNIIDLTGNETLYDWATNPPSVGDVYSCVAIYGPTEVVIYNNILKVSLSQTAGEEISFALLRMYGTGAKNNLIYKNSFTCNPGNIIVANYAGTADLRGIWFEFRNSNVQIQCNSFSNLFCDIKANDNSNPRYFPSAIGSPGNAAMNTFSDHSNASVGGFQLDISTPEQVDYYYDVLVNMPVLPYINALLDPKLKPKQTSSEGCPDLNCHMWPVGITDEYDSKTSLAPTCYQIERLLLIEPQESFKGFYTIYSIDGKLMTKLKAGGQAISLDVSQWSSGIYVLQAVSNSGSQSSSKIAISK